MRSNYDRSKTIISKTTKNYHPCSDDPHSDDPLLLIIWQKTEDESHYLCIIMLYTESMPTPPIGL